MQKRTPAIAGRGKAWAGIMAHTQGKRRGCEAVYAGDPWCAPWPRLGGMHRSGVLGLREREKPGAAPGLVDLYKQALSRRAYQKIRQPMGLPAGVA